MKELDDIHAKELWERIVPAGWKERFARVDRDTRLRIIVLLGLAAMMLIYFSDRFSQPTRTTSAAVQTAGSVETASLSQEEYTRQLEARLTELISSVDGAGRTKVMITLECGTEYVYASQQKNTAALSEKSDDGGKTGRDEKRTGEESLILVNGGGGEAPLLLKEITPTVAGVVVVCSGADDADVRQRITDLVTTALHTGSNRVCVTRLGE